MSVDRAALKEERDLLLASLRDLEQERADGDVGDVDYEALKDDYTARAAAVLRALEAAGPDEPVTPARPGPSHARRRRSVLATAVVTLALLAVGGTAVVLSAGDRPSGQPLSGSLPDGGGAAGETVDQLMAKALDLDRQGKGVEALKVYDEILRDDPDNGDALAYRGWLLKRAGLVEEASVALDRAVAVAPGSPDAHFFRGMLLFQDRNDPAGAVAEFEAFMANDPPAEMMPMVQGVLDRARAAAAVPPG